MRNDSNQKPEANSASTSTTFRPVFGTDNSASIAFWQSTNGVAWQPKAVTREHNTVRSVGFTVMMSTEIPARYENKKINNKLKEKKEKKRNYLIDLCE